MATLKVVETELQGVTVELQPLIGSLEGGVLHMLPGGVLNEEGFKESLKDIYGFTALGKNMFRGGHYHLELNELFFQVCGTALWLLSDFRPESPTYQKTIGLILGFHALPTPSTLPSYTVDQGSLARLRVPAGIYHAVFPLTDERMLSIALGSTPYRKEDYKYPTLEEIPDAEDILVQVGLSTSLYQRTQK